MNKDNAKAKYTHLIKEEAIRLGFDYCGIAKADFLEDEAPRLEKWLLNNMHGKMVYMENHFDKRLDPRLLVDDAKSVVSLLLNYYPSQQQNEDAYKISKYAYGRDYHLVIKEKLKDLLSFIKENIGEVNGRAFVDSAPVLDKVWAAKAGLGWIGKNSNLLNKNIGSFFFIAELIIDLELDYDASVHDYCGTCTRCIDACPTDAIISPFVVDGSKCISYFTIELRDAIPIEVKDKFDDWAFGCDICQDVCPWNRFSKPNKTPEFIADDNMLSMNKQEWEEITEDVFNKIFANSPLKRTGYKGLKRNLEFLKKSS